LERLIIDLWRCVTKLFKNEISEIKIRKTIPEDLPLIYELYCKGQNNKISRINDNIPVVYEEFKKFYDDKSTVRYTVTSEDDNFVGHVLVKKDNTIACELVPSKLNKGIGEKVLSKIMELESRPVYSMGIRFENNKAKNFAIKNGFKEWYTVYRKIQ
jgi:hypothetical protein